MEQPSHALPSIISAARVDIAADAAAPRAVLGFCPFPPLAMPQYVFTAEKIIEADSEEEAKDIFAANSFDFAAEAECDELDELEE